MKIYITSTGSTDRTRILLLRGLFYFLVRQEIASTLNTKVKNLGNIDYGCLICRQISFTTVFSLLLVLFYVFFCWNSLAAAMYVTDKKKNVIQGIVRTEKCPLGKISFGELSFGELPAGEMSEAHYLFIYLFIYLLIYLLVYLFIYLTLAIKIYD